MTYLLDTPVQIYPEIRSDRVGLQVWQALLQQRIRQRNAPGDHHAVRLIAETIPAARLRRARREDAVRADEVSFLRPPQRVRVEVAEEDAHEEGAVDRKVLDTDARRVFAVVIGS